ncbi:arginine deiminase family protein [Paenibacillus sp. FSL L8-0436]|uniref:dimethylarginine dimethylaminohydrolase family protein n=1 Tax=Paenibacillus sp. FSL L8-0436 TaxID=2954686 RepID=UPI003158A0BA
MNPIRVENEYGQLKTVILGVAPSLYFPGTHDIESEDESAWWKKVITRLVYPLFSGRAVPRFLVRKYQRELEGLRDALTSRGVQVLRLDEVRVQLEEPPGLGQMYARDSVLCVNETMIAANLQIDMRNKEMRGYRSILNKMSAAGAKIETISPSSDIYLEGGDVIVDLPYVYVGIGKYASNMKGAQWLQHRLGSGIMVVPIRLANDGILHLDCCMTLIGEKQGIIHRESLQSPLPYPLNTYDFIEVDQKTRAEMGTNILMVGPKQIIVQKRHISLQQQLKERDFEVIPLDFTWHARLDGAFRCATCPIYRV